MDFTIFCFIYSVIFLTICLWILTISVKSLFDNKIKTKTEITILCIMVIAIICLIYIFDYQEEWIIDKAPYRTEYIYSLQDNNMTEERIYLRSGYFREDLYYQYLVKAANGGMIANKVKADNAMVFESDTTPRIEHYKVRKRFLFLKDEKDIVKIYVPENSISNDFEIDLE